MSPKSQVKLWHPGGFQVQTVVEPTVQEKIKILSHPGKSPVYATSSCTREVGGGHYNGFYWLLTRTFSHSKKLKLTRFYLLSFPEASIEYLRSGNI